MFSFSWISAPISGVISTAKQIPSFIVATVVGIIASCFMTSEYPEVMRFITAQFPKDRQSDLKRAKDLLRWMKPVVDEKGHLLLAEDNIGNKVKVVINLQNG